MYKRKAGQEMEGQKDQFEVGNRIIEAGFNLFRLYGIRAVPLDEIALQLGISKKTIYEHFSGKDDLVTQIVQGRIKQMREEAEKTRASANNAIESDLQTADNLNAVFRNMNPLLIMDLKKFHPKAYEVYYDHMYNFVLDGVLKTLQRGIGEGLFLKDTDVEIMARFRVESCLLCFKPGTFPKDHFEMSKVQSTLLHHFIRGIATEKGFEVLNKILKLKK